MASRGCGVRHPGGIYVEVPLSQHGRPVEDFLIDPVVEVSDNLDLAPRGVTLMERVIGGVKTGVWDIFDHVGEKYYPNTWDFVAEVKRMGLSRRLQPNLDFHKLTPDSKIVLMHPRAYVENANELYRVLDAEEQEYNVLEKAHSFDKGWWFCPKCNTEHGRYPLYARDSQDAMPTCIGTAKQLVTGGETVLDPTTPPRTVERQIGSVTYRARKKPEGFVPQFGRGIFMILPAYRLCVIRDPEGGQDAKALERATRSSLVVDLEDE